MRLLESAAISIAMLLAVATGVHGQWHDAFGEIPDSANMKHEGDFAALLLLSDRPEEFLEAWNEPTVGVVLPVADTVPRGVPIVAFVEFSGCAPDEEGLCNASVDFTILRPDGSVYGIFKDVELWKGKPPMEGTALQLGVGYIGVEIDPADPLGRYEVLVTVRDLNARLSLKLKSEFTAIAVPAVAADADSGAKSEGPIQGGYSTKPLDVAVFDHAEAIAGAVRFDAWLKSNSPLREEQLKGAQEHLYYLIGSYASAMYKQHGVVLPPEPDLTLQALLSWSAALGVFGGTLVHDAVRLGEDEAEQQIYADPVGFSVSLDGDMLEVESETSGWSFAVPYYFMISYLRDYDAKDGPRTQMVIISTAGAVHRGQDGHSQATLLLMARPATDVAKFKAYWMKLFTLDESEPTQELAAGPLTSRKSYDEATNIHMEIVTWETEHGPRLLMYSGLDGTYQWNRPHFIDFLRTVYRQDG